MIKRQGGLKIKAKTCKNNESQMFEDITIEEYCNVTGVGGIKIITQIVTYNEKVLFYQTYR